MSLLLAHFTNSLHCDDHVWLRGHLHRRGQASGIRARDPLHEFELRYNRLLIAVADHVAGCNAGWSAAMSC